MVLQGIQKWRFWYHWFAVWMGFCDEGKLPLMSDHLCLAFGLIEKGLYEKVSH